MAAKKRLFSLFLTLVMLSAIINQLDFKASASFTGALQFDADGKFTVMQITDIQENKEVDPEVIALITKGIERYSPDLVVLTGDNIKGLISSNSFKAAVDAFLAPILASNTKFAVTFGNHDDLGAWPVNPGSREEQYAYYKSKGGSCFIDHDVPSLDGTGSGSIPIYPYGQSAGKPAFQVFLMDSGAYVNATLDLDNMRTSQINYYLTTNPTVPSLWFQHIPVPEMYSLLTKVPSGTANSYEGSHDPYNNDTWALNTSLVDWKASSGVSAAEIYKEAPGPPTLSTYQDASHRSSAALGSKTIYEAWCANGNMKGAFFGHNHMNSFVGTTMDGITLGYAKAATLEAYNDEDPGFRIFELDDGGTYTTISVTRSSLNTYGLGNYSAVNSAISAARVIINGNTYFRANNINDSGYYHPESTAAGNGVYTPNMFEGNAAVLQRAIDSVEHNLDVRSQNVINGFAASITSAWRSLSLKMADYTAVDQLKSFATGTTILAPPVYNATHQGQRLPRTYFTDATLRDWDAAINAVVPNLKIPSQAAVDGFAGVLQTAYQALRLKPEYARGNLDVYPGSATVVNQNSHYLYGLKPGITKEEFENNFVQLFGNGHLVYTPASGIIGTGTKVEFMDNATNDVLSAYHIVIFGDINGDGVVDATDSDICINVQNWKTTWSHATQDYFYTAGDVNKDGNIDCIDADIIIETTNWRMEIDQTTGRAF